jgi:hypothetical protein
MKKASRHFKTNKHPTSPPVRSRFAGAASEIVAQPKVTYWVTFVFLLD